MSTQNSIQTNWRALHQSHFQGVRVLVTGGAGFIGSHLCEALVNLDASVTVVDDLCGGSRDNLKSFSPVTFVEGSILDYDRLRDAMQDSRYVFHLAALGSVPASVDNPRRYQEVNEVGTLNVLEAARETKVQRVMFAASSSAYGDNPVPWIETMPINAQSPYAATKIAGEALFNAYAGSYGLDTVALRYFNIFGPRQNANSAYAAVIAAFAKAILAGKSPTIYGDGEQTRDFTFVHNAVHANLLAARCPNLLRGIAVNVGCGVRISVNDLAAQTLGFYGRSDLPVIHAAERAGDLKHSFADLKRARTTISYEPIVQFVQGLGPTLAWYKTVLK